MDRYIAGLVLLLFASSAAADIWSSLFKEKLREANSGNSEAQYDVGTMYQNGRGVKADRSRAIEWYEKAAAQGYEKSTTRLQLMRANTTRFEKTLSQADQGDPESLYDLGNMYIKGVGTNIDPEKAIHAFEQSAGLGNIKSAYKLGVINHEGTGTSPNGKSAFKWFKLAAENGYPAAQYYLGKLYANGSGVRQNRKKALAWLGKAVDGGFDQARGEMIDVAERIKHTASRAGDGQANSQAQTGSMQSAKQFAVEDIVLASWGRGGKPVTWLPSSITSCSTRSSTVTCFSDEQTRTAGGNTIRFKTRAIISNFSSNGSFDVTYRNLVINTTRSEFSNPGELTDEIGSTDGKELQAYHVKTGWSFPHTLNCTMQKHREVTCLKDNAHTIVLTSPATVARK